MQAEPLFPSLETPRLRLRCVDLSDAEAMSALMTPAVSQWVATWPSPFSAAQARERIAKARAAAGSGKALPMAVVRKRDAAFLGYIGLKKSGESTADFGYWLGEPFQGHGYMREAAPAALVLAFERLGVTVIGAGAQLANAASLTVLKGCGMRFVDERMVHAPVRDRDELCAWYEVTAEEFAARCTA